MKVGIETASLVNALDARPAGIEPQVGMGATVLLWTDRHAATVVKVTRCTVTVQEDDATRTDSNGLSDTQTWTYARNTNARMLTFRRTKAGEWRDAHGWFLALGMRSAFVDFSF